jgi:putative FmdB family regulatory protein
VPAYDYECEGCRRTFEVRQRISDPPLTTCPQCGSTVRRLIAPAGFILKGGGWYVTDYPSESRKKGVESEKKATESASPTTPASTASTPASTPATTPAPASKD